MAILAAIAGLWFANTAMAQTGGQGGSSGGAQGGGNSQVPPPYSQRPESRRALRIMKDLNVDIVAVGKYVASILRENPNLPQLRERLHPGLNAETDQQGFDKLDKTLQRLLFVIDIQLTRGRSPSDISSLELFDALQDMLTGLQSRLTDTNQLLETRQLRGVDNNSRRDAHRRLGNAQWGVTELRVLFGSNSPPRSYNQLQGEQIASILQAIDDDRTIVTNFIEAADGANANLTQLVEQLHPEQNFYARLQGLTMSLNRYTNLRRTTDLQLAAGTLSEDRIFDLMDRLHALLRGYDDMLGDFQTLVSAPSPAPLTGMETLPDAATHMRNAWEQVDRLHEFPGFDAFRREDFARFGGGDVPVTTGQNRTDDSAPVFNRNHLDAGLAYAIATCKVVVRRDSSTH